MLVVSYFWRRNSFCNGNEMGRVDSSYFLMEIEKGVFKALLKAEYNGINAFTLI